MLRPLALVHPTMAPIRQPLAPLFVPPAVARREPDSGRWVRRSSTDSPPTAPPTTARPTGPAVPDDGFVSMSDCRCTRPGPSSSGSRLLHAYDDPAARQAAAKHILSYLDELIANGSRRDPTSLKDSEFSMLLRAGSTGGP